MRLRCARAVFRIAVIFVNFTYSLEYYINEIKTYGGRERLAITVRWDLKMLSIKEGNTFKVYKHGGRAVLVLRVKLPRIDAQTDEANRFNDFYWHLERGCIDSAEKLAERISNSEEQDNVYATFSVSFVPDYIGETLKITRIYELKRGTKVLSTKSVFDLFTNDFFFAKKRKNVIKQRKTPSRNAKNIIKDRAWDIVKTTSEDK